VTPRRLSRWTGMAVSGLAAIGCLGLYAFAWIAMMIRRDDWGARLYILTLATLIMAVAILLLFVRGRAPGHLPLRERTALAVTLFIVTGLVGYAVIGIDSTRPVRELPEAQLAFPGATETRRGGSPTSGSIFGRTPAAFTRSYTTTARHGEVLEFFNRELAARGWTGENQFDMRGSGQVLKDWRKNGFTFQLQFPTDNPDAPGPFRATIWGQAP
jgi:hypothetical protein